MSNITPGQIKRLKNIPKFRNFSDEEAEAYLIQKAEEKAVLPPPEYKKRGPKPIDDYTKKYNAKFKQLKDEYALDMNDSNDVDNLRTLVRLTMQAEDIDQKIRTASSVSYVDDKALKGLGDFQRSVIMSINDLQDKLGINRKVRKEKQFDDIPQYLKEIRLKARSKWERSTTAVTCPKCHIELARYWLNFPKIQTDVAFEMECWKCHEKVVYQN